MKVSKYGVRAIVLAVMALMLQNAAAYVAWSEMWPWQQVLTGSAFVLVVIALVVAGWGGHE